jgi:hypothetical protein
MKRKLRLDDLQVDTFETTPVQEQRGTVFGEQCTCDESCGGTCEWSCGATCAASCGGTCDNFNPSCVFFNCYSRQIDPETCM